MKKLKRKLGKFMQFMIDRITGNGLMQEATNASGEKYITPGIPEVLRQAGAEGCV